MKKLHTSTAVLMLAVALPFTLIACSSDDDAASNGASESTTVADAADNAANNGPYTRIIDTEDPSPMIADGVVIEQNAKIFKTSGIGPAALNDGAPDDDPMKYVDPALLVDGQLPESMTVTEAQGLGVLSKIKAALEAQGLSLNDVTTMRVWLTGTEGETADFAGWNRAFFQYFSNTNLLTGETNKVARGAAEQVEPIEVNSARPSRYAIAIDGFAVPGWLVEVEVDAIYPSEE